MTPTDWSRFRVERIGWATFLKRNLIHADLLVAASRRGGAGILEVGIGSGAQSALLSRLFPTVSVDNDWRILGEAKPNLDRYAARMSVVAGDAFALPFRDRSFGVAVSQGLLEHFDDDAIGALLREQLRAASSVAFSVPSDRYPRQDVGDERLMPPRRWGNLVEESVGARYRVRARYYRFDPERVKYSALAGRDLGGFNVLVTVDPR